jgi:hypothetical protein
MHHPQIFLAPSSPPSSDTIHHYLHEGCNKAASKSTEHQPITRANRRTTIIDGRRGRSTSSLFQVSYRSSGK